MMADGTFVTVVGEFYDDTTKNTVKAIRYPKGLASILAPTKVASWNVPEGPNTAFAFVIAADDGKNLYVAWEDNGHGRTQVLFSASSDGGSTWSHALNITANETANGGGFNPSIAVNRSGMVGVLWYDKRDHPNDLGWGVRFAASFDHGKTFLPSVRVSEKDATPGPRLAQEGRFSANGGDTSGLDTEPDGTFRAAWIDNRTGVPQIWTTRIVTTLSNVVK